MIRVLDPAPKQAIPDEARETLAHTFPVIARMQVAERWGGSIDITPDAVPVNGEMAGIPGFFLATGFSSHGFGIALAWGDSRQTLSRVIPRSSTLHPYVSAGLPKAAGWQDK
jgi:glycine/D-amino acid oxidase-like deaminating enzyme